MIAQSNVVDMQWYRQVVVKKRQQDQYCEGYCTAMYTSIHRLGWVACPLETDDPMYVYWRTGFKDAIDRIKSGISADLSIEAQSELDYCSRFGDY